MSVVTDIKQHIIANIQACSSVQAVYGHEEMEASGYPAVFVVAASMEGEFASNSENSRIYAFDVRVVFPIGQDYSGPAETNREEYAEQVIGTAIDDIINKQDIDFILSGADTTVKYVNAANLQWGRVEDNAGLFVICDMQLRVYSEKTVV